MTFESNAPIESRHGQPQADTRHERLFDDAYSRPPEPGTNSKAESDSGVRQQQNKGEDGSKSISIPKLPGYDPS